MSHQILNHLTWLDLEKQLQRQLSKRPLDVEVIDQLVSAEARCVGFVLTFVCKIKEVS